MNADQAYAILELVDSFLDKYADIKDGPSGEQLPNQAMKLQTELAKVLTWLETL